MHFKCVEISYVHAYYVNSNLSSMEIYMEYDFEVEK